MALLMLMLLAADSVSLWADDQLTASLMWISPLVPVLPLLLMMVTLPLFRLAPKVAPDMSLPVPPTEKSVGSINQVPPVPWGPSVTTRVASPMCTCEPEVSI